MAWDAIVIGSGIGGLTSAAALAKAGKRVLVLEQHIHPGGMLQTFQRGPYEFGTGLHYLSGCSTADDGSGQFRRILGWLTDGRLELQALPEQFDIVRLLDEDGQDRVRFAFSGDFSADAKRLGQMFVQDTDAILHFTNKLIQAHASAVKTISHHGMPTWLATPLRWLSDPRLKKEASLTLKQALHGLQNPDVASLLCSRGGNYGLPPRETPFMVHALVIGSYRGGAWYPVGGPARIAQLLAQTIEAAGGEVRLASFVEQINVRNNRAIGVRLRDATQENADHIVSAMGAFNTVSCLPEDLKLDWQAQVKSIEPSLSYLALYIGFEGEIRSHDLTGANHWIYRTSPEQMVWEQPTEEDAPSMFVSFGTLNNRLSNGHHTAEVIVPCRNVEFEQWRNDQRGHRQEEYLATKAWIEESLVAQFRLLFPALATKIQFHELSTPITQSYFANAPAGAMYGLRMTPEHLLSPALDIRTPVSGLYLAGQDAASLGVQGAAIGGLMAAANIAPTIWSKLL